MKRLEIAPTVDARWRGHQRNWKSCTRCPLAKIRTNTCLYRGSLPCELLFLGEAPGESEDLIGYPFVGPAGSLLDKMIERAVEKSEYLPPIGITNVVACFPNIDREIRKPTEQEVMACRSRLEEVILLARPRLIVTLGQVAKRYLPMNSIPIVNLTHPAAFLHNKEDIDSLGPKKFILSLAHHFQNLYALSIT